jgi:antitoxin MazE
MQTKVQRWGNSLAVRIPKAFADDMGLSEESAIEMELADGALRLSPAAPTYRLEDLLAEVTDENLHEEVDTGPAVGKEVW